MSRRQTKFWGNCFPIFWLKSKSLTVAKFSIALFCYSFKLNELRKSQPKFWGNYSALIVKDFLTENPQKTYVDAGQHFNLTRARISQLMKLVHELPAPFIEKMRNCDNQAILKAFSGKTLLKIADFKTEKERQENISRLLKLTNS